MRACSHVRAATQARAYARVRAHTRVRKCAHTREGSEEHITCPVQQRPNLTSSSNEFDVASTSGQGVAPSFAKFVGERRADGTIEIPDALVLVVNWRSRFDGSLIEDPSHTFPG